MRNFGVRHGPAPSWMPLGASLTGFLAALLLLMGIMGGYILGAMGLVMLLALAPLLGVTGFILRLARPKAASVPVEVAAFPAASGAIGLRDSDILGGLAPEEVARVVAIGELLRLRHGTVLASQGEVGTTIFLILDGQAELTTTSALGEVTVRIAGPGESLPLAALLGSGRLITNAYAMTDLRVLAIPCDAFRLLCRQQPRIGTQVYSSIADILASRYGNALNRFAGTVEDALRGEAFANV